MKKNYLNKKISGKVKEIGIELESIFDYYSQDKNDDKSLILWNMINDCRKLEVMLKEDA